MAGSPQTVSCKDAEFIAVAERDRKLGIEEGLWPPDPPRGWRAEDGVLRRFIAGEDGKVPAIPAGLVEVMLRFPSAPIHGIQRLHEHHASVGSSENFHTMRLLRSSDAAIRKEPISRIFLMHCGLNELRTMGLYYRLSSRLINQEPTTACLIRPFPGHLTRYPFQAFAETPLDNYLWDGSHLFRQFLRFMAETQWLLSAIVRRSSFRCASGANLLAENEDPDQSRLRTSKLAAEMHGQWLDLYQASVKTAEAEAAEDRQQARPAIAPPAEKADFVEAIDTLRSELGLTDFPELGPELLPEEREPKLHVIGYSLGGFTAQSVFMSWPFQIASCSTLLAGGALRELAPTGFADPEEWQTVLHSLRYELDDRLLSEHLGITPDSIAGMDRDLFTYFKRTFYEVFQQEYRGSIESRYEAFRDRMLFIVGGDDPVVRPESVLQSGPKGGLNLLEVGGLSHFIDEDSDDPASRHQRTFWVPEMATLIHRFARTVGEEQDEQRPCTWFDAKMQKPELARERWDAIYYKRKTDPDDPIVEPLLPAEEVKIGAEGELSEEMFERCLDDLLHRVRYQKNGVLFILRNEMPTLLVPPTAVREAAAAVYHDDLRIAKYCLGIAARRKILEESIEQTCLLLPWNAGSIMRHLDLQRAYPSQAESAGGQVKGRPSGEEIWRESLGDCYKLAAKRNRRSSIRFYDGNRAFQIERGDHEEVVKLGRQFMREPFGSVPSMPDCWIWLASEKIASTLRGKVDAERGIRGLLSLMRDIGEDESEALNAIQRDWIRIVDVSRARYNPRFRGRLLVEGRAARKRILHASLCLAASSPILDEHGARLLA